MKFNRRILDLDCQKQVAELVEFLRHEVLVRFKRHGAVVGTSGGIDSSVVAALCCRAFGPERMLGVIMPDKDSSPESTRLATQLAQTFGYPHVVESITAALEGAGCYQRRDQAIRSLFPEFSTGWKAKIWLPQNLLETDRLNVFRLTVTPPGGQPQTKRLPAKEFFEITAASNMKQRTRMMMLYYHAERLNYAVIGTANKNEHQQGFFVKHGDGGVDCRPISHLYKTQIYQLAEYLNIPEEIKRRTPTTDTYPDEQTQEEFFFGLKFETMDLLWYAKEHDIPVDEVADVMGLTPEQVHRVWRDLDQKQRTTEYLRMAPSEFPAWQASSASPSHA